MEKKSFEETAGLFDRVLAILDIIQKVPDKISDEEVISLYKNVDILLMAQANPKLAEGGFSSKNVASNDV